MESFIALVKALGEANVRFVVMGIWGINYYAQSGSTIFMTADRDLFLARDADNLLRAWSVCESQGCSLWSGNREPLDRPHDRLLADRVVERLALTVATTQDEVQVDLSLVMGEFAFEEVWNRRRTFVVEGVSIPVARLTDLVLAKAHAGRNKDRLFLATYREALEELQRRYDFSRPAPPPERSS